VAEARLQESERHQRELLDNLNAGVVVHSPDTSVVRINKKASLLLGLSPGQRPGEAATEPSWRFVHEDGTTIPSEEYPVARVLATGAPIVNQVIGVGRPENRDRSWLLMNAYPEVDAAGALEQVVVTFVDITRRKESEEALHETQELLRLAMDQSPAGIAIADAPSGKLRYVNDAALLIRGGDRAGVVNGVGIDRYVASWQLLDLDGTPLSPDAVPLARSILYGETNSREFIIRRSETDDRIVFARAAPVIDIHGKVKSAVVVFMDITEAKRAGQAVARSEAKYRGLFDSLMDGFAIVDMDGVIQESNAVFQSMLGYSAEELRQKTIQDLTPQPWQGVQARILEEQVLRRGYSDVYEQEYRRKDGTIFPVELRTFLLREAGRPVAMWTISRDVGDSRAMQAQLALASRLAALGTLVAGVAHEVNNPLAAALANQEMALSAVEGLLSRLGGDATVDRESEVRQLGEVVEELADAQEAARRIERIVKDLKTFGRSDSKRTRVRLIDIVEASMRWLPASIDQTATVRVENGNPPDIVAAFGQIEQVVVNLVTNAAKASSPQERGKVIVRLGPGADGMARLEVIDHGKGIEPKILARIFDPFFTTRDVGEGMGLGLSISQAIVTSHGGTLTVETEVGKGTTFRMELPASLAEA
jgi:two-component system cell cycle sensor histidine kinase/response regulator CckA